MKNAIKFTPHGGCVGVCCRPDDGSVVTEVIDSGQGIEPAVLPTIFNAFEQGGTLVTRQFGGVDLVCELRRRGFTFPAIALSGYGQEEDIRRSKEAGFVSHLTKPTSPDRLAEAIAAAAGQGMSS